MSEVIKFKLSGLKKTANLWLCPLNDLYKEENMSSFGRQRGPVVRAPDLKSGGHGFKSRSDHLAGVVSRWTLVQLLGHACK